MGYFTPPSSKESRTIYLKLGHSFDTPSPSPWQDIQIMATSTTTPPSTTDLAPITLIPFILDRSYGLSIFYPSFSKPFALLNLEYPVFFDLETIRSRLLNSHRSPNGTTRVHSFNLLPYNATHTIRLSYAQARSEFDALLLSKNPYCELPSPPISARITRSSSVFQSGDPSKISNALRTSFSRTYEEELHSCLIVTDTPVINSSHTFSPRTLRLYPNGLPCYTDTIHRELASSPLIEDEPEKGPLGLPLLKPIRLTKAGVPRRKPRLTIAAKRAAYLSERCCDIPPSLFHGLNSELHSLLTIPHNQLPYQRYGHPTNHDSLAFLPTPYPYRSHKKPTTWDEECDEHFFNMGHALSYLIALNNPHRDYGYTGDLRHPLIYLFKHHASAVLALLAPFQPLLSRLRSYPTTGYRNKTPPHVDAQRAALYRNVALQLTILARSMHQGPFQAARRLRSFSFPQVTPPHVLNVEPAAELTPSPASPEAPLES